MRARRPYSNWRSWEFLALAVLVHFLFLLWFSQVSVTWQADPVSVQGNTTTSGPMDVTLIEPKALQPLAPPTDEEKQAEEVEKKHEEETKKESDPNEKGEVVEVPKPAVEIRPEDAKRLSEYDSKVERETVARSPGKPDLSQPLVRQPTPLQPKAKESPQAPGPLAMRAPSETGTGVRKDERLAPRGGTHEGLDEDPDGDQALKGEGDRPGENAQPSEAPGTGYGKPLPSMSELRPSGEAISQALGRGSIDYLKDVDEGEETLLNTKRWKYSSFFNRVKRAVAQSWRPDDEYRKRDPSGQIYGGKNRYTVLKVSLRPDGSIRDLLVERPCGVDFLDDAAIDAFRDAEPFPNPPLGLVDKDSNLITFRFGFFFEITSAPTFRFLEYSN
ncbi:MAG: TonB family protein [Deltaproteobacteria bacterium]|nr:TonB family protein [Deltaproteobacteria bacterium]